MSYNILKVMTQPNGKRTHVLLTDGLSQILEIKTKDEAVNMVKIFNENSDSGWVYELRSTKRRA